MIVLAILSLFLLGGCATFHEEGKKDDQERTIHYSRLKQAVKVHPDGATSIVIPEERGEKLEEEEGERGKDWISHIFVLPGNASKYKKQKKYNCLPNDNCILMDFWLAKSNSTIPLFFSCYKGKRTHKGGFHSPDRKTTNEACSIYNFIKKASAHEGFTPPVTLKNIIHHADIENNPDGSPTFDLLHEVRFSVFKNGLEGTISISFGVETWVMGNMKYENDTFVSKAFLPMRHVLKNIAKPINDLCGCAP